MILVDVLGHARIGQGVFQNPFNQCFSEAMGFRHDNKLKKLLSAQLWNNKGEFNFASRLFGELALLVTILNSRWPYCHEGLSKFIYKPWRSCHEGLTKLIATKASGKQPYPTRFSIIQLVPICKYAMAWRKDCVACHSHTKHGCLPSWVIVLLAILAYCITLRPQESAAGQARKCNIICATTRMRR